MNWLEKLSQNSLIHEISLSGWSEDQLHKDGVSIWRRSNEFYIDLGDWAKVEVDDLKGAIGRVHPGASVGYDFEAGPEGDGWSRIF
jgi:hypothetical protein